MKKALIQLHIAVLLAGFTGVLGKLINMNEILIVWYRLLLTVIALVILFSFTNKFSKTAFKKKAKIFGIGILSSIHWVLFFASIKYSNVSVGLVCLSAVSFFTAIAEPIVYRTKPKFIEVLFGLMSVAGIYLIFHFDTQYKTGIILGILSSLFAAIFPVLLKKSMNHTPMETVLTWQMIGGAVFISLIMPVYLHYFPSPYFWPTTLDWIWLLILSLICSVFAFQFSLNALKKVSAFTAGLTYSLEPIYGVLLGFAIFNEAKDLNIGFFAGFGLICITILLHTLLLTKKK